MDTVSATISSTYNNNSYDSISPVYDKYSSYDIPQVLRAIDELHRYPPTSYQYHIYMRGVQDVLDLVFRSCYIKYDNENEIIKFINEYNEKQSNNDSSNDADDEPVSDDEVQDIELFD